MSYIINTVAIDNLLRADRPYERNSLINNDQNNKPDTQDENTLKVGSELNNQQPRQEKLALSGSLKAVRS